MRLFAINIVSLEYQDIMSLSHNTTASRTLKITVVLAVVGLHLLIAVALMTIKIEAPTIEPLPEIVPIEIQLMSGTDQAQGIQSTDANNNAKSSNTKNNDANNSIVSDIKAEAEAEAEAGSV